MKITALTENTTFLENINTEHGLSLFIETDKHKILFDTGQTSLFAENADKLVSLGIKGFWNFTQCDLMSRYDNVAVENVHLGDSLMTLCYQINKLSETGVIEK